MKLVSNLLVGASLFAAVSTASAQVEIFLDAADQAKIVVSKTDNGDGTYSYGISSPNSSLVESESFACNGYTCGGFLKLKTDGPVDFSGLFLGPHVSYAYASVTSPTIGVDYSLWQNTTLTHIHEAYTYANTNANSETFVSAQFGNSRADIVSFDGTTARIKYFFAEEAMLSGATTQYQTFQLVGVGKKWIDIELGDDYRLANDTVVHSTNKGTTAANFAINRWLWTVEGWSQSNGHYADIRFLTNGDSRYDDGLNLSGYNTLEFEIDCELGAVFEAFFGGEDDSSQNFLGEINCDNSLQSHSFNISGYNASDIQTGLWLLLPEWKNYHMANFYRIYANVKDVVLKQ